MEENQKKDNRGNNFYQTNNEILKLDILKPLSDEVKKDLFKNNITLDFYFNHYISRKENLQRIKNECNRGLFYLSYSIIEIDFNISNKKARNLVKRFINNGVIECIEKGKAKGEKSLYAYTSVFYSKKGIEGTELGAELGQSRDIVKPSNTNALQGHKGIEGTELGAELGATLKKKTKQKIEKEIIYMDFKFLNSVKITIEEYNQLIEEYDSNYIMTKVTKLEQYLKEGKKYNDHFLTIYSWITNDGDKAIKKKKYYEPKFLEEPPEGFKVW